MNTLSSHVLDTANGKPVANLALELMLPDGQTVESSTDNDGRCKDWKNCELVAGQYRLRFQVKPYLIQTHGESFYPHVDVHFELQATNDHYHVPLLISPFGFSSYRGS